MYVDLKQAREVAALLQNVMYYKKDRAQIVPFAGPMELDSNWSGGSKTFWTLVDLSDGRVLALPESGAVGQPKAPKLDALPANTALIESGLFLGKPIAATIHMHPDNLTKLIPATVTLTDAERFVLGCIASMKSVARADAYESKGLSERDVETIKAGLLAKGLIDKRGAITVAGRNARVK